MRHSGRQRGGAACTSKARNGGCSGHHALAGFWYSGSAVSMAGRKRGAARAAPFCILSLPTELQAAVFAQLDDRDKAQLAFTCRWGCRARRPRHGARRRHTCRAPFMPAALGKPPLSPPACRHLYQLSLQPGLCRDELRLELQKERWTGSLDPAAELRARIHSLRCARRLGGLCPLMPFNQLAGRSLPIPCC